jgi:protein-S-isoprenylcysteine O-methyltransferase Ste14
MARRQLLRPIGDIGTGLRAERCPRVRVRRQLHRRLQRMNRIIPLLALVSYVVMLGICFGVRAVLLRRRIRTTGFRGISGRPGSRAWWAGVSFVAAIVLGLAAPTAALTGAMEAPAALDRPVVWGTGIALAVVGSVLTLAAQTGMGASWRVGVDETERTTLVTDGPFAVVRNPVFTAMTIASIGWALMVPTWVSLAAVAVLVLAVQLQVRVVEEPYLRRTHPRDYLDYERRVGRFVPGIGR